MSKAGAISQSRATDAEGSTQRANRERATRQRAAVRAVLEARDDFASAQQLHDDLRRNGEAVGLTTVYRRLQLLSDQGEVDTLQSPTLNETLYRLCNTNGHHHHLVCRECGHTVEVEASEIERWTEELARTHEFTDVSHTIEVFGTCAACTLSGQAHG
ncbi:MAG TPA: transcriptional repressor [Pseudonocardiaceae bacterium]|jgi:Fur family ferric uptake transcriptional regulator|nr:transcriptional repressor [Pseudonocardiaceae bacterium]